MGGWGVTLLSTDRAPGQVEGTQEAGQEADCEIHSPPRLPKTCGLWGQHGELDAHGLDLQPPATEGSMPAWRAVASR